MFVESLFSLTFLPWLFLVPTILSTFFFPKLWPTLLLVTLGVGYVFQAISYIGFAIIISLFSLAYFTPSLQSKWLKYLSTSIVILSCIALAAHLLPGFNNHLLLNDVIKSQNSIAFTLYANFDKPMILFVLLALFPAALSYPKNVVLNLPFLKENSKWQLLLFVIISLFIVFGLAIGFSLIQVELTLPAWWWVFALNNLLLTCVVEEVFFRGFILQKLSAVFTPIISLLISSVLFGVAHFAGGIEYMLVATIAGVLYGVVYMQTGKITYAIYTHFILNILHLILFTYPRVLH